MDADWRIYHPLADLTKRWGISEEELLHWGATGKKETDGGRKGAETRLTIAIKRAMADFKEGEKVKRNSARDFRPAKER